MATVTISICDWCKSEQRSDAKVYWSNAHAKVYWKVPPDGLNGGTGCDVLLCRPCREALHTAIYNVLGERTK